ncbi:polysaccharide biosynthesis tyrosine autokinase [Xylophilus sp. GOD-11R]|uniref:polysaccharide biosynthesis tyrosine autokinase n=1 Tax=Xylophilus sp. GOD-11R TaxID=3089814 RepID=UPI00298D348F|nr:polysaccharide biosynthesis tyrosine autokinase [Xylophilus sp. GOD-11R]WPB56116.1 polysaccharide biosynthesis tyrosine autokinase [Xylophilus sp. GOD-11R]
MDPFETSEIPETDRTFAPVRPRPVPPPVTPRPPTAAELEAEAAAAAPAVPTAPPDKIGDRFLHAGLLNREQVARVIERQKRDGLRFGEAAVQLGLLSQADVQSVLSQQFRYATGAGSHAGLDPSLAIALAPYSAEAEAVRRVRAELSIRLSGLPKLAVAIVSPGEGEGKSYLAASLAIAYSQLGKRTLLVNANLRSSGQRDWFGLNRQDGLSTMLAGRAPISAGEPAPGFPLLHVIGSGPQPPNPLEILLEPALERLLTSFAEDFDVFIVDTPGAGISSDAQVIARQVGQCLLVGRQHVTRLEDLERCQSQLATSGAQTVGIVYNTFDATARSPSAAPDVPKPGPRGTLRRWLRRA